MDSGAGIIFVKKSRYFAPVSSEGYETNAIADDFGIVFCTDLQFPVGKTIEIILGYLDELERTALRRHMPGTLRPPPSLDRVCWLPRVSVGASWYVNRLEKRLVPAALSERPYRGSLLSGIPLFDRTGGAGSEARSRRGLPWWERLLASRFRSQEELIKI